MTKRPRRSLYGLRRKTSEVFFGWLAAMLVRGPNAEFITHDLEDLYWRDRARGVSAWRASCRRVRRVFGSAVSVWQDRGPWPRVPGREWLAEIRGGTMLQDLRFALRLFRKHPIPVGIAIGGLAVAIGVVASVFTLVDVTMLRQYRMDDPSSVVSVGWARDRGWPYWSYGTFRSMQEGARLSRVEAQTSEKVQFGMSPDVDAASTRRLMFVSGGYFEMLGGRPSLGRALATSDDVVGAPPVVVVSHHFWSTDLNGDPSVVGKAVWLNGSAVTLVGVLRPDFTGPVEAEIRPSIWAPFAAFDDVLIGRPSDAVSKITVEVVARIAPGASMYAAQSDLSAIVKRASPPATAATEHDAGPAVQLYGAGSLLDGPRAADSYMAMVFVFGISGLVLALACANTANLLLAAATTRMPEMGIRLALGASRRRIVRQMINESLLLGLTAGGIGFLLAIWLAPILASVLVLSPEVSVAPDLRALLVTVGVALACGLGAGLSPARFGARGQVLSAVKAENGSSSSGARPSRLRTSFVGFQAAVSIFLLVAASLLARSAILMARVDAGFDIDRLLTVSIPRQRTPAEETVYVRMMQQAVQSVPSVTRVSVIENPPFGYSQESRRFTYEGKSYELIVSRSDAEFFATAGLRVLRGRAFSADEVTHEVPVALISESLARVFFPGADPTGQPLSGVPSERDSKTAAIIIGVVSDAMLMPRYGQAAGTIYRPIRPERPNPPGLVLRTANPRVAARTVEDALRRVDPRVRPSTAVVRDGLDAFLGGKRTLAWLSAPTAAVAVLLAVLGVFGVTAFVVGQRTKEMSLRMALGASSADVLRLVIKDGLRPVVIGLGVGLGFALIASRVSARELSGIGPYDPISIGLPILLLLAGALTAVILPARRAARSDPASLLRQP